uniref:Putative transposable element n=1 Tax=Ixodes ricinus TaxID=34613 RepID=A0A6B0V8T4_IXORI
MVPKFACLAEWQRAVRRRDVDVGLLKDPKVCERHFKPEHLRTTSTYTDCDGLTVEAPMKLMWLTPDAFSAIFPDCPSYISDARKSREVPEVKRKRPENQLLQKTIQESLTVFEEEEKQHKVQNLCELISRVNERRDRKFWCTTACETCLTFAHIEPALQAPELLVSVAVSQDLSVRVYFKYAPLVSDDVCIPGKIRDVRVLDNLLDDVERYIEKKAHQQEDKVGRMLGLAFSLLDDICDDELHDDERADALLLITLLNKNSHNHFVAQSDYGCDYDYQMLKVCSLGCSSYIVIDILMASLFCC